MTMTASTFDEAIQRFRDSQHPQRYNSGTLLNIVRIVRQLDADNFPAKRGTNNAAHVHLTNTGITTTLRTVHIAQRIRRALAGVQPSGSN